MTFTKKISSWFDSYPSDIQQSYRPYYIYFKRAGLFTICIRILWIPIFIATRADFLVIWSFISLALYSIGYVLHVRNHMNANAVIYVFLMLTGSTLTVYEIGPASDFQIFLLTFPLIAFLVPSLNLILKTFLAVSSVAGFLIIEGFANFHAPIVPIKLEVEQWLNIMNVITFCIGLAVVSRFYTESSEYLSKRIVLEQEKGQRLLDNILPRVVSERLKTPGTDSLADAFQNVTILFVDIVGFTRLSKQLSAMELVDGLNSLFTTVDEIVAARSVEKIKTIGDAYMAAAGIPIPMENHAEAVADAALDILEAVRTAHLGKLEPIQVRIGVHTGDCVAGVIGKKKFIYDLWGDAVNTASRMESSGIAGEIQVSETTFRLLRDRYVFAPRGNVEIKGIGVTNTYLLKSKRSDA